MLEFVLLEEHARIQEKSVQISAKNRVHRKYSLGVLVLHLQVKKVWCKSSAIKNWGFWQLHIWIFSFCIYKSSTLKTYFLVATTIVSLSNCIYIFNQNYILVTKTSTTLSPAFKWMMFNVLSLFFIICSRLKRTLETWTFIFFKCQLYHYYSRHEHVKYPQNRGSIRTQIINFFCSFRI